MSKFVHLHGHTEYSLLDGLSKIKKLVKTVKELGMSAVAVTDHGSMYGAIELYKEATKEGVKPIIGCLPPGQVIYTKCGIKPIEDIEVGDLVLTHKGNYKKVLKTMKRDFKGTIYGVKSSNSNTVWVTKEHPVLVSDCNLEKIEWVRADKLNYGRRNKHGGVKNWKSYALFPKLKNEVEEKIEAINSYDQPVYGSSEGITYKANEDDLLKSTALPLIFRDEKENSHLIGLFMAEGIFHHDLVVRPATINLQSAYEEDDLTPFMANIQDTRLSENKINIDARSTKDVQESDYSDEVLSQFRENLVNKRSQSALYWSKDNLEKLLESIVEGDKSKSHNTDQITVKVKSKDLAYGIKLIIATLGYGTKVSKIKDKNKIYYQVAWNPKRNYKRILESDDYLFLPIKDIEKKYYEGPVYNFSVEDDNSYVSEITLHNCELYVAKRSHKDKEGKLDTEPYHLTVLAKNHQGYLNLMKLVTIGHLEGYYYRPRIDRDLLKEYHEGLIALSGCPAGEFIRNLKDDSSKDSEEIAKMYLSIFGEGNYYFEVQNHEYNKLLKGPIVDPKIKQDLEQMGKLQDLTWGVVKDLSKKLGIKVVATNDFHYIKSDDSTAQDAVVCVQTGKFIKDIDRLRMIDTPNLYLRPAEEMEELFADIPDSIQTSLEIAEKVDLEISLGKASFPIFDIPQEYTPIEYLRKICFDRFEKKFSPEDPHYQERRERLEYEISVIDQKGYATYFLIVADFMNWANSQGIITNTRGSAAGSFILYCLGITLVDPIEFMLPFERFLNPLRPSLPDIDCDMADDRRGEIIEYVKQKYGEDKVAQIITFGTMMGRAAVRDIGRVLGLPYGDVDRIAKLVPPPHQGFHKPLEDAIKEVPELAQMYKSVPEIKTLLDLAQKVEGTVRQASVHAAGVVIAPGPLTDYTPLQRDSHGEGVVTQYDMFSVGEDGVGLVKMDFLGIRNLSILGQSVKIVKATRGQDIDLSKLPLDDPKTYDLLARGETMGLFQIEGEGMTKYLVELKPTNIFDIMAMIALYRPGPLAIIPEYITRKHNPSYISYFDDRMKTYLERSLGLLVYQDDVLLTAINLAGYTWLDADKFRKAMGKKIPEEMAKQKDHFIEGCIEKGMSEKRAHELFKLIEPFAAYGFNKAHAASYAIITYHTAYMKANFPVEFMAAVMTAEYGDTDKIAAAMDECKKMGIVVLPPDVNKSGIGFTIEDLSNLSEEELKRQIGSNGLKGVNQGIRFGLSAIKNVGISAIESIILQRKNNRFSSLMDLCLRVDNRLVNRKTLESLIKSGALDSLGSRSAQMISLDQCLEQAHSSSKNKSLGQVGLFADGEVTDDDRFELPKVEEWTLEMTLQFEKELLGFYLHEPPFLSLIKQAESYSSYRISSLSSEMVGQKVILAGMITGVKKVVTKKTAAEMAFIKVSNSVSELEGVVFPKTFQDFKNLLVPDNVVLVWAKVDKREEEMSLIIDKIIPFDPNTFDPTTLDLTVNKGLDKRVKTEIHHQREVGIYVPRNCGAETLQKVNKALRDYPGKVKVALYLHNGGNNLKKMDLPFGVKFDPPLISELEGMLGKGTIKLT